MSDLEDEIRDSVKHHQGDPRDQGMLLRAAEYIATLKRELADAREYAQRYVDLCDAIGFANRPEGQGGVDCAGVDVVVAHVKDQEARAEAAEAKLAAARADVSLQQQAGAAHMQRAESAEAKLAAVVEALLKWYVVPDEDGASIRVVRVDDVNAALAPPAPAGLSEVPMQVIDLYTTLADSLKSAKETK